MNTDELLGFLCTRGRDLILERFEKTSCIASTRIALEVLKAHGRYAYPQAVKVRAMNRHAVGAAAAGRPLGLGAHVVEVAGTGAIDPTDNSWDGHLVAVLDDNGSVLLDLSADQMARPDSGLHAEPLALRFDGWPTGMVHEKTGTFIGYTGISCRSYRQSRDWTLVERWGPVVDRIMAELPA